MLMVFHCIIDHASTGSPGNSPMMIKEWVSSKGVQGNSQFKVRFNWQRRSRPTSSGWHKNGEKPFPTFTTSRPSPTPLLRPAGLHDCNADERARWAADLHRFPPYQYKDIHCLVSRDGALCPPNVAEREVILGFPVNYTKQCMKKSFHGTMGHRDARLTLLGNSWSVPVISWLIAQLLLVLGLIPSISLQEIVDKVTPGRSVHLQSLLLRPPLRHSTVRD